MEPRALDQRAAARALPWLLSTIGFLGADFISAVVPMRLVWHLPLEHRFSFELHPLGLAADYYGHLLLSLAAGAVAWAAGRLASRRARPEWLPVLSSWCFAILAFDAGLHLYLLSGRQPIPAALPDGLVPR